VILTVRPQRVIGFRSRSIAQSEARTASEADGTWSTRARFAWTVLFAVVSSTAGAQGDSRSPLAGPYLPTDDAVVLQQVPPASNRNVQAIRPLRKRFDQSPNDLVVANRLASAYIDFGRELGDAHYVGYAEAVIAPWMRQPSPPVTTLILDATILQYRHQFAAAREQLDRAIAADPRNAQAWLTTATLDMVRGDYDSAATSCAKVGAFGGTVVGAICSANRESYLGRARHGVSVLEAMSLQARGSAPAFAAWIEGLIAESAERLGDWTLAEDHYRKALGLTPDDNFVLVAYADFLLDRGRYREVLKLLAPYVQSDTAFLRVVLAKVALHEPDVAKDRFLMAARFEALALRGDDLFGREQVRFALDAQGDAATALALAEQNWKVQRAPWDARVYLEAALAAKRPDAAAPVVAFVDRTRLEDPVIQALVGKLRAR
jgi:tetratricopeptide (TPR) repeat protein